MKNKKNFKKKKKKKKKTRPCTVKIDRGVR